MEAFMTMMGARTPVSRAGSAAVPPELPIKVRLPGGGWQVGFRVQPGGRTIVEVTREDGSLAGMVTSSRLPILSVDAGWAGFSRAHGGDGQWWALAIGHVPAGAGQPDITFSRGQFGGRLGRAAFPDVVDGLWVVHDGLWVAAASGRYTTVRLAVRSATRTLRLKAAGRGSA
jgi:hypothetical protein